MNMKKILSIALSLVMIMALFTGCGSNKNAKTKDNGSYFKEVKKMQEIKTGTGEVELSFDVSADSIKKDKTIPAKFKKDGKIQGKLKVETTTESTSKLAAKISLQYLTDTYEELTTVVIDGSKLYMNMGSISKFISKIDSESGKQFESALKQIGATGYISLNLNQVADLLEIDKEAFAKAVTSSTKINTKVYDSLEKDFSSLQGKDGNDYTLTVNGENADAAVTALVSFCDNSLKDIYNELMDVYIVAFGADSTIGKQYADMKKDTKDVDNAIKKVKDNKDKIVSAIKDSNANIVSKAKVTGDKGSRKGTISIETGEIKNDDASMNISLTSNITEGKPSVKDLVPTENVTDLTSIITMLSSQMSGKGL